AFPATRGTRPPPARSPPRAPAPAALPPRPGHDGAPPAAGRTPRPARTRRGHAGSRRRLSRPAPPGLWPSPARRRACGRRRPLRGGGGSGDRRSRSSLGAVIGERGLLLTVGRRRRNPVLLAEPAAEVDPAATVGAEGKGRVLAARLRRLLAHGTWG